DDRKVSARGARRAPRSRTPLQESRDAQNRRRAFPRCGRAPVARSRQRIRRLDAADGGASTTRALSQIESRSVMDAKKLEALKQKYAGTKGGDIFHPPFAAVAAHIF